MKGKFMAICLVLMVALIASSGCTASQAGGVGVGGSSPETAPLPSPPRDNPVNRPEEPSELIARHFLLSSPTFMFDGIEDSVRLVATNTLRGPSSWEFIYEFECAHGGYGDRSGQALIEAITPHTARITVVREEITSAIIDEKWDMMKQAMLPENTGQSVVEMTRDGVLLRLSTDKQTYRPGERVLVTVSAENVSDMPITYTMWNQGDPAVYVAVDTEYAGLQQLYEEDMANHVVLPVVTSGTLEAGETIIRDVVWDQIIHTYPDPIQTPSGEYAVSATFYLGRYSPDNKPELIVAEVAIEITEAGTVITQEEAKRIALALPEVQEWYKAHSGSSLVKCEDDQYYVWSSTGWEKASPDVAEKVMKEHQPGSNVLMKDGVWEVLFFEKMGPLPHEISLAIDAHTGQVTSSPANGSQDGEFQRISEQESEKIAQGYLRNSPTFIFDGIEESLRHMATNTMRCPFCWEFVFEFQCRHAGYGDRSGQVVAEALTRHIVRIIVNQGQVTSAIMDEKWDMMLQRLINKPDTEEWPYPPEPIAPKVR